MPPSRALHILAHPRQLELPMKRTGTGIRLGAVELVACLSVRDVTVFDFTTEHVACVTASASARILYSRDMQSDKKDQITLTKKP